MKQLFKKLIFAGAFLFLVASPVATLVVPQTSYAADPSTTCEPYLLGVIPPWYRGLTKEENGSCVIVSPNAVGGLQPFIWKIVLNGIQIALVVASLIAFFFILYGAFLFLTGGGTASQVEKGRKSILNAIIGLVISIGAVGITNLIFGALVTVTPDPASGGIPHIAAKDLVHNGLNLLYYIAGIVAVIVIIVAGINYITSMGDSGKVTRAKNMVFYAVIGLGILLAAFAITAFIVGTF
jgi:hypothetical protein